MKRILVMVSGGGTNLQAIMDACAVGEIKGQVVKVISSSPTAFALERARRASVEAVVIAKADYPDMDACGLARHAAIVAAKPDVIVLAGFLGILPEVTVAAYPGRIINTHPALIPAFCGKGMYGHHVHEAVLAKGCRVTGATVHFVTAGIDEGPIIDQVAVRVEPGDTAEKLAERVMEAERPLLVKSLAKLCEM